MLAVNPVLLTAELDSVLATPATGDVVLVAVVVSSDNVDVVSATLVLHIMVWVILVCSKSVIVDGGILVENKPVLVAVDRVVVDPSMGFSVYAAVVWG